MEADKCLFSLFVFSGLPNQVRNKCLKKSVNIVKVPSKKKRKGKKSRYYSIHSAAASLTAFRLVLLQSKEKVVSCGIPNLNENVFYGILA